MQSPGTRILHLWRRLSPYPGGKWLFAKIFSRAVPYSGSVGPRIRVLEPGRAEVEIPDRRSNRNHLGSVHAIALINAAEQASGLAMLVGAFGAWAWRGRRAASARSVRRSLSFAWSRG